jgi:hypothetical protein
VNEPRASLTEGWPPHRDEKQYPAECHGFRSGEGEIRTPVKTPAKTVLCSEGGAESGALATTDPALGTLIDAWPALPEAIRAGILAMVKAGKP